MRPLSASASDRLVPPVKITRKAAPAKSKKKAARSGAGKSRRKPLPTWARPALVTLCGIALLAGVSGASYWAWDAGYADRARHAVDQSVLDTAKTLGLTVQEVTVTGRRQTSVPDLLAALGADRGDSMLAFDPEQARQRIAQLAWVETAAVKRALPDTIHIEIVERRPFALWQHQGKTVIIDRSGHVVSSRNAREFRHLPKVVGDGAAERAQRILGVINSETLLAPRVAAVTLVRGRRWNVRMDNGIDIRLPEKNVQAAWRQLAALELNYRILSRDLKLVDMRIDDRLIVRLTKDAAQRRRDPGRDT